MHPDQPLKVVAIGGGTGLAALLRALKIEAGRPRDPWKLTGIVTVSDNGGSSGRLRTELGGIPPGDLRNCLTALIREDSSLSDLMNYRFQGSGSLAGHALGNLMLLALAEITGSWVKALRDLSGSLVTLGRLFPSTLVPVTLVAEDMAGQRYDGETAVNDSKPPLARLWLEPQAPDPLPESMLAVLQADLILLAPGSLYTSTIPNLLIDELRDAIVRSEAPVVYIANLMTEPGETAGLTLEDHLAAIQAFGGLGVRAVIANEAPLPASVLDRYRQEGGAPILISASKICGVPVYSRDLVDPSMDTVRHHPERLIRAIRDCLETL
ncbi:gluconeogenesis factor YvcK family protein [Holophaga foetida]|uniref:gluconeogenesis factor YvcK family protein n=1 Tax=Holophaga foetida TaxID=35839 RepID=UPI0002472A61|nr:uridine diphosphate-N-acetylglucosamine-binding protein YvcK [Holophaga foetida]